MLIKAGVDISRMNRQIRRALTLVYELLKEHNQDLIVTATYDGNHSPGSLHYSNDAFDFRIPKPIIKNIVNDLQEHLGSNYDVVYGITHIHVEWDPR